MYDKSDVMWMMYGQKINTIQYNTEYVTEGFLYTIQMQWKLQNIMKFRSGFLDTLFHTNEEVNIV
jgi:hypothetical protein